MIPKTFFARLAEKSPIVIARNRLYQTTDIPYDETSNGSYIKYGSSSFFLEPSDSLLDLESFYRYINANELFEFKRKYIQDKLNSDIPVAQQLARKISSNRTVSFLVNKVFPLFNDDDFEVDALLSGDSPESNTSITNIEGILDEASETLNQKLSKLSKAKPVSCDDHSITSISSKYSDDNDKLLTFQEETDLDSILSQIYERQKVIFTTNPQTYPNTKYPPTILSQVLGYNDILTFDDKVYVLEKTASEDTFRVFIKGEELFPHLVSEIKNIEHQHQENLKIQLSKEAESEFNYNNKVSQALKQVTETFRNLTQRREFNLGDVGFIKLNDTYFATLKVHPFVLKDYLNNSGLYYFNGCKVGVNVRYISEKDIEVGLPRVIGAHYEHPFLSRDGGNSNLICMGDYFKKRELDNLEPHIRIATLLSNAKTVLTSGYTETCRPYNGLYHYSFSGNRISATTVRQRNLKITNLR